MHVAYTHKPQTYRNIEIQKYKNTNTNTNIIKITNTKADTDAASLTKYLSNELMKPYIVLKYFQHIMLKTKRMLN